MCLGSVGSNALLGGPSDYGWLPGITHDLARPADYDLSILINLTVVYDLLRPDGARRTGGGFNTVLNDERRLGGTQEVESPLRTAPHPLSTPLSSLDLHVS